MQHTDPQIDEPDPLALLDAALEAAAAGAAVLRASARSALQVRTKGEAGNLVTDIDVAAERAVRACLARLRPDDLVTGEELPENDASDARVRWSIDPIDGTTNFARGMPYFGTSVAAVDTRTGQWLAGAVDSPGLDRIYHASLGGGAWVRDADGLRKLGGPTGADGSALLGMGLSYERAVREQQYRELPGRMESFTDMRSFGSGALGLCAVAEGAIDAFIETDLEEFDWAAAALIAEEAGVIVERPAPGSRAIRAVAVFIGDVR